VTALRFYEDRELLTASRSPGNQRRYPRTGAGLPPLHADLDFNSPLPQLFTSAFVIMVSGVS
jgi:hypothetical protein